MPDRAPENAGNGVSKGPDFKISPSLPAASGKNMLRKRRPSPSQKTFSLKQISVSNLA